MKKSSPSRIEQKEKKRLWKYLCVKYAIALFDLNNFVLKNGSVWRYRGLKRTGHAQTYDFSAYSNLTCEVFSFYDSAQ